MPDEDGFKLLEVVGLELDLPAIMMSANGETSVVMKGITHGACDYLIKPVRMEELRNIWQHVVRRRDKYSFKESDADDVDIVVESSDSLSKKRKEQIASSDFVDNIGCLKKSRVNWSVQLHQQFVNAVNQLGIDKAVPKKILDIMNVHGLTRENVASHLQKYRLYLKRLNGVMPEPCPVASFQASEGGQDGGYMQVRPGGKTCVSSIGVKGANFSSKRSVTRADPRAGTGASSETVKSLCYYGTNQKRQAANRAQVLEGLELVNVKEQKVNQVSVSFPSLRGMQRLSSIDMGFLLKAPEEVHSKQEPSISFDDLAAQDFRTIMMLENTGITGSSRMNSDSFSNEVVVETFMNQLECNKLELEVSATDEKNMESVKQNRSNPHFMFPHHFSYSPNLLPVESYTKDSSTPPVTGLSNKTDYIVPSPSSAFFSTSQVDVSDYTVDEFYLVSELKSIDDE